MDYFKNVQPYSYITSPGLSFRLVTSVQLTARKSMTTLYSGPTRLPISGTHYPRPFKYPMGKETMPQPRSQVTSTGNLRRNWHVSYAGKREGLRRVLRGRIGKGKSTNCTRRLQGGVRRATYHFAKTIIAGRITKAESLRVSKTCCLQLVGNRSACWT